MKKYRLLIGFLLFLALPAMAQKRKASQLTPEQQAHKAKLEKMIANTQCIMFIDSMVVDKKHFLQYYKLSPEIGRVARYQDFFHTQQQPNAYVYVNELGTRCYLSQECPDSTIELFSCENVDNRWTRPTTLKGTRQSIATLTMPYFGCRNVSARQSWSIHQKQNTCIIFFSVPNSGFLPTTTITQSLSGKHLNGARFPLTLEERSDDSQNTRCHSASPVPDMQ